MSFDEPTRIQQKSPIFKILFMLGFILLGIFIGGLVWGIVDPTYAHMPLFFRELFSSL